MKEMIFFAPGINGTEFLRTLAAFGIGTIGCRVMNATELAKTALMRSGISAPDFIPRKDEAALIDTFLRRIGYFKSASFADSENMASALFSLRSLIRMSRWGAVGDGVRVSYRMRVGMMSRNETSQLTHQLTQLWRIRHN